MPCPKAQVAVSVAGEVEVVGVGVNVRIAVGCGQGHHHPFSGLDELPAEFDVLRGRPDQSGLRD
jgi:hypothetical protein